MILKEHCIVFLNQSLLCWRLAFCFVGWVFFWGEALGLATEFLYKINVTEMNKRGINGKANLKVLSFTEFPFVCHSIVQQQQKNSHLGFKSL